MRRRRYYAQWVWSIKKFMDALMIAYYTDMSLKKCINSPSVGYHVMMTSVAMMKAQRMAPQQRCHGIFLSFQGLSVCLLIRMMQKTSHDMQMRETPMECSAIWLILPNGRRLIIYIQISGKRKEILGLVLSLME